MKGERERQGSRRKECSKAHVTQSKHEGTAQKIQERKREKKADEKTLTKQRSRAVEKDDTLLRNTIGKG